MSQQPKPMAANGYHVVEAADGEEAVAVTEREAPALAMLHLRMPRLDGNGAPRILCAAPATRDLPVVPMTVNPEPVAHPPAVFDDLGIADFMQQPFVLEEPIATVDRVAASGRGT